MPMNLNAMTFNLPLPSPVFIMNLESQLEILLYGNVPSPNYISLARSGYVPRQLLRHKRHNVVLYT